MYRVIDLFAGCGGLSLGFQYAGFDIVGAYEFWKIAADCYSLNFNHPVFRTDLTDTETAVNEIRKLRPDIIIGGPPCQDFSQAGKRVEDKRAGLTESFAKIITDIKPRWFVMENVDRAQNSNKYAEARNFFKQAGYGLTEIVLDASYTGVPQKRKRFFCIGSLEQPDGFLKRYIINKLDDKPMTVRDYFGKALDFEYYYRHPRNYCRRAIFSIDEPAPTVRGVNRPVPQGYPGHRNDACALNPSIRPMTTLERALVQTFPADFKWIGNKTETEQMIGNAVPVKLAKFIGDNLRYHIEQCIEADKNVTDYDSFANWLNSAQAQMTDRAKKDIISRLKRADSLCKIPVIPDAYYIFQLEHTEGFCQLTSAVRSQIKRAVTLYNEYCRINKPAYITADREFTHIPEYKQLSLII